MKVTIKLSRPYSRQELSQLLQDFSTAILRSEGENIHIFYSYTVDKCDPDLYKFACMEITERTTYDPVTKRNPKEPI